MSREYSGLLPSRVASRPRMHSSSEGSRRTGGTQTDHVETTSSNRTRLAGTCRSKLPVASQTVQEPKRQQHDHPPAQHRSSLSGARPSAPNLLRRRLGFPSQSRIRTKIPIRIHRHTSARPSSGRKVSVRRALEPEGTARRVRGTRGPEGGVMRASRPTRERSAAGTDVIGLGL